MPHSGGGGHSGGGFHGGSHHGSSSGSSSHYSSRPFKGARPYLYYRHYTPIIIYSDRDPRTHKPALVFPLIVVGIMGIAAPAMILGTSYHNPSKNLKPHEDVAYIDDQIDALTNEEELELKSIFTKINEKTGVMPALVTVQSKYYLEDYVLDYYINTWSDESHFLIAYSAKAGTLKTNWSFESAQGYDTDDILYESFKDRYLLGPLTKALDSDKTVGESFIYTFNNLLPELLKEDFYVEPGEIGFLVIWEAFIAVFVAAVVGSYVKEKAMQKAEELPEGTSVELKKCPNCGTSYYKGVNDHCHKCGRSFLDDDFEGL